MIRIIAGGKKSAGWELDAISEYGKRLRKPFDISWTFMGEDKLLQHLDDWPFSGREFVICCDERGENISSDEYSRLLEKAFVESKDVVILIGGAYGFDDAVREKANFVWGFSRLVFPHALARVIVAEQTYRAMQISIGGPYHHS